MDILTNKKILYISLGFLAFCILGIVLIFVSVSKKDNSDNTNTPLTLLDQNRRPTTSPPVQNETTTKDSELKAEIEAAKKDYSPVFDDDKIIMQSQLEKNPDVFLINSLPHTDSNFSMRGEFVENGDGKIRFIVQSTQSQVEVQQAVNAWLLSLGLTSSQIQTFDITYTN